jgi:hypothetical protein
MVMNIRETIAALGREQDRLLADDTEWLAHRDAEAALRARGITPGSVLRRDAPISAQAPSPVAVPVPSNGDGALFGDARDEMLARALGEIIAETRKEWQVEISKLKAEMREIISTEVVTLHGDCADLRGRVVDMDEALSRAATTLRGAVERIRLESRNEKHDRQIRDETIRERSLRITDLQRENAAVRADRERQHRENEFGVRDRRLDLLETKIAMVLKFLGADLPRGFLGGNE